MKNLFVFLFSLILSVVFSTSVLAYDVLVDGIYYNLNSEGKTAEVTYGGEKYRGKVVIPSSITKESRIPPPIQISIIASVLRSKVSNHPILSINQPQN